MSLGQNSSQTWNWQQAMDSHSHPYPHHYYHQQHSIREQMFEKPLTPSDVGKLNRLVIPKQHAERYFPLDSESGEKGLLLSFEDEVGKSWKFRYSYWTSSQSYVLTKGWSRFVKEKRLDAGDVVLFERTGDRLFIGCRRRSTFYTAAAAAATATSSPYLCMSSAGSVGEQAGGSPVAGSSRRMLRLFGVNLDCGPEPQNLVSGSWSQL